MRKIFLQTIIVLFSLFVSSSCIDDVVGERKASKDTEKLVSFVVNVAGANSSRTRALTEQDENTVKTVEALLFDEAGKYTYQPIFSSEIVEKGPSEIAFTMKVPEGTFNMVILANVREKVINLLPKLNDGMSKSDVLNLLVAENAEKWNVTSGSDGYKLMPMSGDIPTITIQGDNTSIEGTLVRMLAKIDVNIATDVREEFNLSSVHLYNNSVKGKIAPDTDSWDTDHVRVVKPSIPQNAQNPNLGTALIYADNEIQKENNVGVACLNTIYTFEANKGVGDEGMLKNTCLVIGGKYDGDTKDTYYRIDFVDAKSTNKDYLALLRNHQYRVQVTAVKGPGFDDPETAFQSRPVNIEASIVEWSDGDINDIIFDGQHLLGVSQSEFLFSREERTAESLDNDLYVVTDYPAGWTSEVTDDKGQPIDWLKISPNEGGPTKIKTKLLFGENTSNQERTAYIQIKAGRFSHVVRVIQSDEAALSLEVLNGTKDAEISQLDFISIDGNSVEEKGFNLVWKPAELPLYFQNVEIKGGGVVWDNTNGYDDISQSESPILSLSGDKSYLVRPKDFTEDELNENPFILRSTIMLYSVTRADQVISKSLLMQHLAKNIIPSVDDSYDLDGEKHQFNVRSNMAYNVSVKKDDKRVLKLITTKGKEDTSDEGYPIYFELIDDAEGKILNAEVTLLLTSPIGEFDAKEVIVNCTSNRKNTAPGANSYMVKPNGEELLIPIARCNEWQKDGYNGGSAIAKLGENEEFTAHFVWTDNSNGMASNSVVQSIGVKGKGPKGFLTVKPGSAEGNAVVAIKNTKGEIMWSWHIWNTTYSPEDDDIEFGDYMDRNLGALVNAYQFTSNNPDDYNYTRDKPTTYGLLYQWGRKDPFPSSRLAKQAPDSPYPTQNNKPIYDEGGNVIDAAKENRESIHNNLEKSVLNPNVFYYSNDGLGDWLTANSNEQNDNLWSADSKSLYDPCPEGWKVPSENWLTRTTYVTYNEMLHQYSISFLKKAYVGGLRSYSEGKYTEEDRFGYYWTANPAMINRLTRHGHDVTGQGSNVTSSLDYRAIERATGAMMRCVRYDDTND